MIKKITGSLLLVLSGPLLISVLLVWGNGVELAIIPGAFFTMLIYPLIMVVNLIDHFPVLVSVGYVAMLYLTPAMIFYGYQNYHRTAGKLLLFAAGFIWEATGLAGAFLLA